MAEVTFTVADIPAVEVSATATAVSCNGDTDGLVEVSASGGTSLFEYSDDGSDFGSTPVFTNLGAGIYTFYAQDSNGCSASVEAEVAEPAVLAVTGTIVNDTGAGDGSIDISVDGGNGGYSFSWTGPDSFTSADEDLTGIAGGEYTVTVTDANGCSVSETFGVPVGIEEWTFLQSVNISPNPSTGMFNLNLTGAVGEDLILNVYDAQARIIWTQTMNQIWGAVQAPINLSGVSAGVYQLELQSNGSRQTVQLLKQ